MEPMKVDSVAIIGAGPGGLAAAKYLIAERKFSKIDIFEQRGNPGGTWNFTTNTSLDANFTVPRTKPSQVVDEPVVEESGQTGEATINPQFVSPLYDFLETNIPHTLMNYSDQPFPEGSSLFPKRQVVIKYLEDYARELEPYLKLGTQVLDVSPAEDSSSNSSVQCGGWSVTTRAISSSLTKEEIKATTTRYDAVICANGHYSDPFIPDIPGLAEFHQVHPGVISHSKYYRRPDQYKDKRVIVVGNSASGLDLSTQISAVSSGPVLVSEKEKPASSAAPAPAAAALLASSPAGPEKESRENKIFLPEITEFLPSTRSVRFANGRVEDSIDSVVFCTGYQYSFPFLSPSSSSSPPAVVVVDPTNPFRVQNTYEHIFYRPDPTLVFLGLPQRIVPLPVSEAQAGYVARVFSGRVSLPVREEMEEWERTTLRERGDGKAFHNLAFPRDAEYINRLFGWSMMATDEEGENGGAGVGKKKKKIGKTPPYWGEEKQWVRERFPLIKAASRKLGDARHKVQTLEELGFDFRAWKAEKDAEEKKKKKSDGNSKEDVMTLSSPPDAVQSFKMEKGDVVQVTAVSLPT